LEKAIPPAFVKNHVQFDIEAQPPVDLKTYVPAQYDYWLESKIQTGDKHGNQRIQLMVRTDQPAQEDFFWHIIDHYRDRYQVIWISLCPKASMDCFSLNETPQAAWFDPDIASSNRHLGFDLAKSKQGLYLNQ